jgi:N-acetylglutamate synthase-like GNAT family acetyltransferase
MDQHSIRLAVRSEKGALEALQFRASLTNDGDRESILAHPDAIEIPEEQIVSGRVFLAERAGKIAGFSAVEPRADGETELDALFVDPDIRRRGVGRQLVDYCAEIARMNGSKSLHVVGNPHAMEFYLECGFTQIGITETRFGPGILLRKNL